MQSSTTCFLCGHENHENVMCNVSLREGTDKRTGERIFQPCGCLVVGDQCRTLLWIPERR